MAATDNEIREAGNELALHALQYLKQKQNVTGEDLRGAGSLLNALRRWRAGKAPVPKTESYIDETEAEKQERLEAEGDPLFAESLMGDGGSAS